MQGPACLCCWCSIVLLSFTLSFTRLFEGDVSEYVICEATVANTRLSCCMWLYEWVRYTKAVMELWLGACL